MYAYGRGVMTDYTKAVELYTQACNMDNRVGCYNLGLLYDEGYKGVRQDYFKARELYAKSCDMGNGSACFSLGLLYSEGKGVRQDYIK
ncbi:tetratricopeptide repeat protein, partial [Helicobacter typhlonius]|uniref:tetratricopeptide repeat protein n=1 Tax=Helicobacter typhlonius TaxID=76936 RepID=UPI002FE2DE35